LTYIPEEPIESTKGGFLGCFPSSRSGDYGLVKKLASVVIEGDLDDPEEDFEENDSLEEKKNKTSSTNELTVKQNQYEEDEQPGAEAGF
jgi:hypothetical protein